MSRRTVLILVGIAISAVSLWIVAQTTDLAATAEVLRDADPLPLVAIVGVVAVQLLVRAFRWSVLLPTTPRTPTRRLVPPLLVGYLGNAVLPARLGEPIRAVLAARRERVGIAESLGTVLAERLVDIASLAIIAFASALLVGPPAWVVQGLGAVVVISLVGMAILLTVGIEPLARLIGRIPVLARRGLGDALDRFARAVGGPSRRRALLAAAGISAIAWLLDGATFWLAGQAVHADLPFAGALLVSGMTVLGTAIPSAPGYVGTFELAAAGTATLLGVPAPEALGLAVIAHVMTVGLLALGGAASLVLMGASLGEVARSAEASGRA